MQISSIPLVQWSGVEARPLVIAGPCSAESEAQLDDTARRLAGGGGVRVDFLRAGIWKARTRPNTFEGIGDGALPWLSRAGKAHGFKTATEVASPAHLEAALRHGIDLVWVGARTTVNPFSVQELAEAARGVPIPVLVKNPTSPDLGLWVGALERFAGVGVHALGAIHRGFSVATPAPFRNAPMWNLVIELRRALPSLPVLTDPSHIAGRRDLIADISQRALDLGLDGLMIEAHPDPDHAWSDAAQQITPERLHGILAELKVRHSDSTDTDFNAALEALRERIDRVDADLVHLLAQRMGIVELIAEQKRAANVTSLQVSRWRSLLRDRMRQAEALGLDPSYVKAIYDVVHRESIRRQSTLMLNGKGTPLPDPHVDDLPD